MQNPCARVCAARAATANRSLGRLQTIPFERRLPFRLAPFTPVRHATHGAQGRANGPKNGPGKRLGAKKTGDQYVVPGNILFRQRGTKWFPGDNVGIGRDHTLFAKAAGYVKYYRDPFMHPKRQYIGVTFERADSLPHRRDLPRRRRLGLMAVPRREGDTVVLDVGGEGHGGSEFGVLRTENGELPASQAGGGAVDTGSTPSKRAIKAAKRRKATGRVPGEELGMRPDYSYRESNYQIGRAAERAGVKVRKFVKGNRFVAWRKRSARIAANAEKRAVGKKKGKKDKAGRGGTRKGGGQPMTT